MDSVLHVVRSFGDCMDFLFVFISVSFMCILDLLSLTKPHSSFHFGMTLFIFFSSLFLPTLDFEDILRFSQSLRCK